MEGKKKRPLGKGVLLWTSGSYMENKVATKGRQKVPLSRNRIDNDNKQQKQLERKLLLGTWNCHKSDKTIGN